MTTTKMVRTVPPVDLPVTLREARAACQLTWNGDDALVQQLIYAATSYIDGMDGVIGRAIMPQTWKLYLDYAPAAFDLPLPPFRAVSAFNDVDSLGVETPVAVADYRVVGDNPASIYCAPGVGRSLVITYQCGYTDPPAAIKQAVLLLVRHWYDNPTVVANNRGTAQFASELPFTVAALLQPFKVWRL